MGGKYLPQEASRIIARYYEAKGTRFCQAKLEQHGHTLSGKRIRGHANKILHLKTVHKSREGARVGIDEAKRRLKTLGHTILKFTDWSNPCIILMACGCTKTLTPCSIWYRKNTQCKQCLGKGRLGKHRGYKNISLFLFGRIRRNAKARGISFDITTRHVNSAWEKCGGKCVLSGVPIELPVNGTGTASLDRIDSTKGYTPRNIQFVHKHVNSAKMDLQMDEFVALCTNVTRTQRRKHGL